MNKNGYTIHLEKESGIRYDDFPSDTDTSFFLCKIPRKRHLNGIKGSYTPPAAYFVENEDVEKFDKSFPPKKKEKLPTQLFET